MKKPPYGISRWEWHIEPRLTVLHWILTNRCLSCGLKKPSHKFACVENSS